MKIMDRLGNVLKPGDVVYFSQLQTIVVVMDVEEPGRITPTPGQLSLGIKIPITPEKGKTDFIFAELMKVHTPEEGNRAEAAIDQALSNVRQMKGQGNTNA